MAQTAVSWLMEKLKFIDKNAYGILYNESFEQAKAMEKEQIKEAYAHGSNDRLKNRINEQYYNETYES